MEHRARLLDVAAFLDRIDRADPGDDRGEDFRLRSFKQALVILSDTHPHRAGRVLELLSDPTDRPSDLAPTQSASGAYPLPPEQPSSPRP